MKKSPRIVSLTLALVMLLSLTACAEKEMDFLKNGWDGGKEPTTVEETTLEEETTPENGEEATDNSAESTTKKGSSSTSKKPSSNKGNSGSQSSGSQNSGSQNSGSQSSGSQSSGTKATQTTQKTYTAAEALELYKTAANKVKTTDGVTCTRTKEVITTISGEIPSLYQSFGFKEGTNTEQKILSSKGDIKDDFCVEGQSFVCNLTSADIKSATVTYSGNNKIVTINVKDDTAGTYDRSSKCVSTISIPIGTWTCKGVVVKGTINANGQLTSLYYKMPTYVTSGGDSFAFALEQYWTITH